VKEWLVNIRIQGESGIMKHVLTSYGDDFVANTNEAEMKSEDRLIVPLSSIHKRKPQQLTNYLTLKRKCYQMAIELLQKEYGHRDSNENGRG